MNRFLLVSFAMIVSGTAIHAHAAPVDHFSCKLQFINKLGRPSLSTITTVSAVRKPMPPNDSWVPGVHGTMAEVGGTELNVR